MKTILSLFLLLLPSIAMANEACDFTITFPEEPYVEHKCERGQCFDIMTYTKVFDLSTTVQVRAICHTVTPDIVRNYTPEVMQETLRAMTNKAVIQSFDTSYREEKNYRQASLIGEGQMGMDSTLYVAQLWISEQSSLSVEAELAGTPRDDADQLFSEILRSIRYEQQPAPEASQP